MSRSVNESMRDKDHRKLFEIKFRIVEYNHDFAQSLIEDVLMQYFGDNYNYCADIEIREVE